MNQAGCFDLTGRVVVVTGGNGGIGFGLAEALMAAGADVAIWGRSEEKNAAAQAALSTGGGRAVAIRCDISDEAQVTSAFAETVERLGKVDSLFANAGIGAMSKFIDMSLSSWRRIMDVNLDGAFLCLREAARHMVERGEGGSLIAISSVSAIHGAPRMEHYAAGKGALLSLMRALAVELAGKRIRCNTMVAGWTETEMNVELRKNDKFLSSTTNRTPVGRWAVPSDLGPVAVFLADPRVIFHTGDAVVVDGGYSIF